MAKTSEIRISERGIEELWSVYRQVWIPVFAATANEIAALPAEIRERAIAIVATDRAAML